MNTASSTFMIPKRQILTKDDLDKFQESQAYEEYASFIVRLNDSVKGLKLTTECIVSPALVNILEILDTVNTYCKEIPPVNNEKSRFGNPAFRDFYDRVTSTAFELHENLSLPPAAIPEISKYFTESWGNKKRIDYGTGHEANFMTWLLCLEKLGLICPDDYTAVVLRVFQKRVIKHSLRYLVFRYIDVMRNLQFNYWLEPAGSHGVWGLDDYHFLPFLFGSSQLAGHKYIRPKSIHDKDIVDEFSKDYMYLACIKFINSVKTASLRWNSPMLDDISGVREWKKVNEGMLKMYKGEVLAKLPIMQHFMFGSLISFEEFPDCCGIKVPSAVGAKQMSIREGTIKRLPFD
ncbi:2243_t:CDS:2 [Cetraspora pellucida]|uniref:Serine/threonine-protein phosphatase 2A activator n=1 Tax=Cetraspora pellucida TaxID=1433469 RepID=A0A9N9EIR0_9GLOM|nr:2243_t:CDS:2 [Cetraspora pellucida]